jgi:hypothetical protein
MLAVYGLRVCRMCLCLGRWVVLARCSARLAVVIDVQFHAPVACLPRMAATKAFACGRRLVILLPNVVRSRSSTDLISPTFVSSPASPRLPLSSLFSVHHLIFRLGLRS